MKSRRVNRVLQRMRHQRAVSADKTEESESTPADTFTASGGKRGGKRNRQERSESPNLRAPAAKRKREGVKKAGGTSVATARSNRKSLSSKRSTTKTRFSSKPAPVATTIQLSSDDDDDCENDSNSPQTQVSPTLTSHSSKSLVKVKSKPFDAVELMKLGQPK